MLAVIFLLMPQTFLFWRLICFQMLLSWKQRLGTDHHKLELAHGVLLEAQYLFEVYITCQHFTVRFLASKTETVFLFFLQTDGLAVLDPHSPTWAPATPVRRPPGRCGQGKLQPQGNVCAQWIASAMDHCLYSQLSKDLIIVM